VTGSSTDRDTFTQVAGCCAGARTMVILDSDHSADHVFAELDLWSPLVTPGNYLIVQDGIVTYLDDDMLPGPLEATTNWLPDHPEFEVDETRERMMFTLCPSGFLRRRPS
jgi:cephalosporin hydroxylase